MSSVSAQQIQSKCYQSLARCGFIRHAPFGLDWPINQDFHCWVRINVRQQARHFQVEPLVGIHAPVLEQFWTGLKVGAYRAAYRREIPTIATRLLALADSAPAPLILDGSGNDRVAIQELVALYRETGLGFARSTASYEAIEPVLRRCVTGLAGNPERLATCLYLMGRIDEAVAFVEDFARARPRYFNGFALHFLKAMRSGARCASA